MRISSLLLRLAAGTALCVGLGPVASAEPVATTSEPGALGLELRPGGELFDLSARLGLIRKGDEQRDAAVRLLDWIGARTAGMPVRDHNGDGVVDRQDAKQLLVDLLRTLRGDLTGDGVVDADDVRVLAERIAQRRGEPAGLADGDLNGDGLLDETDLGLLLERQGDVIDMQEIEDFSEEATATLPGPWNQHAKYFSDTFPPHWPGPPFWPPFPPSHEYTISEQWLQRPPYGPGDAHAPQNSQHGWPPNHLWQLSVSWPNEHMFTTSDINWPPNHLFELSGGWPGNHTSALSRMWPPNHILPNSHNQEHLTSWSLLHPDDEKPVRQPSPHRPEISLHWADHQIARSLLVWPTNHIREASLSWGYDHQMNLSLTWPAGHFGGMSRLWPSPTPIWPPNHMVEASRNEGDPHTSPLPPLFPPDHTIFRTIKELIPLIPTPTQPAEPSEPAQPSEEGGAPGSVGH